MLPRMQSVWAKWALCALLSGLASFVLWSYPASAKEQWEENARLLAESKDFRVRTQAALALGTSGLKQAVGPLCRGVDDENRTVRIAAATALGRLQRGGKGCLQRRLEAESDASVKSTLEKALAQLDGGPAEPSLDGETRFYVAIDKLAGPERLNAPVRAAFVKGASGQTGIAIAPAGEKPEQATKLLAQYRQARAFLLSPKASKPTYEGDKLEIKLSVAILSYPDKAIVGSFSQKVSMSGVSQPDPKSEEELLVTAAESAMQKFLALAPNLD